VRLSLINVLGMLASVSASIAETAYAGALGTSSLAGIAVVFPIVTLQQSFAIGAMGGGVSSAIGRAPGAGDQARAQALAFHALLIGLAGAALLTAGMLGGGDAAYRMLGAKAEALAEAQSYSRTVFIGSIFVWLTAMFSSIARGSGNMKIPSATFVALFLCKVVLAAEMPHAQGRPARCGLDAAVHRAAARH
jgi:Na+-driven multidrug efflux pump